MDCFEARTKEALETLENDVQKIIFLDWFTGGELFEGYDELKREHIRARSYNHVNSHDWDEVHSFILETISMGMG